MLKITRVRSMKLSRKTTSSGYIHMYSLIYTFKATRCSTDSPIC